MKNLLENPEAFNGSAVTPQMTLLEIMYRWRATEKVFQAYENQAGFCLRCQALFDRFEGVAQKYQLDLPALLRDLHTLIRSLPPELPTSP